MIATFVGRSDWTDLRIDVARALGMTVIELRECSLDELPSAVASGKGAIFLAMAPNEISRFAEAAIRHLNHVFLDVSTWPPLHDSGTMSSKADEAGVQVSYSRPLWYDEDVRRIREAGPTRVLTITAGLVGRGGGWRAELQSVVDLCGGLCGTFARKKIDAEALRGIGRMPLMLVFGIRFLNGALAQARIGPSGGDVPLPLEIVAGLDGDVFEASVTSGSALFERETEGFLTAVSAGVPVPVQLRTGNDAAAIVEDIMAHLR